MIRFIKFLGGNYLSEFDLNGEVTHLICSDTLLSGTTIDYSKSSSLRTLNAWKEKFHKKLRETGERDERVEVTNSFTVKCLWQSWIEDCDELQGEFDNMILKRNCRQSDDTSPSKISLTCPIISLFPSLHSRNSLHDREFTTYF